MSYINVCKEMSLFFARLIFFAFSISWCDLKYRQWFNSDDRKRIQNSIEMKSFKPKIKIFILLLKNLIIYVYNLLMLKPDAGFYRNAHIECSWLPRRNTQKQSSMQFLCTNQWLCICVRTLTLSFFHASLPPTKNKI